MASFLRREFLSYQVGFLFPWFGARALSHDGHLPPCRAILPILHRLARDFAQASEISGDVPIPSALVVCIVANLFRKGDTAQAKIELWSVWALSGSCGTP